MTDYGHDLLFGTFVTPSNHPPHHPVEQAVVADRAGLEGRLGRERTLELAQP